MNLSRVEAVANAVLYEGYMLYPYRPSALKNRRPWTWGIVHPRAYSETRGGLEPWRLQSECLLSGGPATFLEARVRFLRPTGAVGGEGPGASAAEFGVGPIRVVDVAGDGLVHPFTHGEAARLHGLLEIQATPMAGGTYKLTVRISNVTPQDEAPGGDAPEAARERALSVSLVSTHVVLGLHGGAFIPPRDPPPALREAQKGCRGEGLWPILVGEPGERDLLLCSPIVLDDYPRIAPESPGDFFDGTEIDEILILRLQTLTEGEKREMARGDERVRALLARAEELPPERLARLHGALREDSPEIADGRPGALRIGDQDVGRGARVRLHPQGRADIFDLALAGRTATVVSVEQDYDGRSYFTVTVDDDPGRDLGLTGQPGHRFFFAPHEVEPLEPADP
jgi:hypothetical protein